MWIKDYKGVLHNANSFSTFRKRRSEDGVVFSLVGIAGRTEVTLLKFLSLREEPFLFTAMERIETGLHRGSGIVDLSTICTKYDYTTEW